MAETNISKTDISDYTNTITTYSVADIQTDGAADQFETEYQITNWGQNYGYYRKIPELRTCVDALARWTIGKGFIASPITELALGKIKGFGKDSFNSIIKNLYKTSLIAGDSFAEIIRDEEGYLTNLKPLDPSTIKIIANRSGVIKRYEQTSKTKGTPNKKFDVDKIFHLSRNRNADEIHGVSLIESVEDIILMRNEAMTDYKKLLHRNVCPIRVWHLDTDDDTKIAQFKGKVQSMKENFEDIFIPKGTVETEISAVPSNATLNPLPWIDNLNHYFFQATGVPEIIVGGSQEMTEATAKIAYLAFEQTIEEEQLQIEEQIEAQLDLSIKYEFPASLRNELISDEGKEESMQAATPEDTTVNMQPVEQKGTL